MKTLHITNAWHPRSGGIRTFYKALIDAANAEGHEMRMVVPSETSRVEQVGEHCKIYHVASPSAPFSPSYRILYPQRALFPGGAVHRILNQEQPELVEICDKFTMNYVGGLLRTGRLPGIRFRPTVVALSCERLEQTMDIYAFGNRWAKKLAPTYLRWLYFPMADHHIAVSSFVADELRQVSDGHKVDRGVWIGAMGVDAATFAGHKRNEEQRRELIARCGGDESTRLLLYAGRMAPEKNIPLLFRMMSQLAETGRQEFRLVMAGDGDTRADLEREAEQLAPGLVHFVGHRKEPGELARLMVCCDAFVHPNATEPFGIAPLEAMAAGVPLVAPNTGGVVTYAHNRNAWLAAAEPGAFAAAVLDVFSDEEERKRRVLEAQRTAEARTWPLAAARYLRLYRELHARVCRAGEYSLDPAFFSTRTLSS
jgi:alpha-1,6-mannosyltransferase